MNLLRELVKLSVCVVFMLLFAACGKNDITTEQDITSETSEEVSEETTEVVPDTVSENEEEVTETEEEPETEEALENSNEDNKDDDTTKIVAYKPKEGEVSTQFVDSPAELRGRGLYEVKSTGGNGLLYLIADGDREHPVEKYKIGTGSIDEKYNKDLVDLVDTVELELDYNNSLLLYNDDIAGDHLSVLFTLIESADDREIKTITAEEDTNHIKLSDGTLLADGSEITIDQMAGAVFVLNGKDIKQGDEYMCAPLAVEGQYRVADDNSANWAYGLERYKKGDEMPLDDCAGWFSGRQDVLYINYISAKDFENGNYDANVEMYFPVRR